MRRTVALLTSGLLLAGAASAGAVSDGNYDYRKQHCSGKAEASRHEDKVEKGCYAVALRIAGGSHEYVVVGIPMSKRGESPNSLELCIDLGSGAMKCAILDRAGVHPEKDRKGTKVDATKGAQVYFGADDNLDRGEHDGSTYINNGPSDGGGIQANLRPETLATWLAEVQKGNTGYVLTHPLPVADAGAGFCADGICFSLTTQRRTAYKGGAKKKHRDVSDYEGKKWDPESCGGPDDTKKDCGGKDIRYWHNQEGDVYAQPGFQIYEDPDPQGSPIGPYPLPAFYVGTCGLVVGGGNVKAPASPFTNKAGQLVVKTGCG
jgi:hypothetical protein